MVIQNPMYPIPQWEHLVENRNCKKCGSIFPITDKDMEFYEKNSPSFPASSSWTEWRIQDSTKKTGFFVTSEWRIKMEWDKARYIIPPPTLCPDCRQQRRLAFRNERKLYKRKCDATWNEIISIYSPDKPYTVYHQDYWWSDAWDAMKYGREFDFSRSAMEQMEKLIREVPRMALVEFNNENSSYSNFVTNSSDIYLSTDIFESTNVSYSSTIKRCHNSLDLLDVTDSENSYECIGSEKLYNCKYCRWSGDCKDSIYLYDCHRTEKSMFCVWLRNKKFCILNKQVSESEYLKIEDSIKTSELSKYLEKFRKLLDQFPRKSVNILLSESSTGDILKQSKSSKSSFLSTHIENCAYTVTWYDMSDCMDTTIHNPECFLDYEAISWWKLNHCWFNNLVWIGTYLYYCDNCFSSSHLFLCTWLRNKSYCILNKQYTKEEYEVLVPRIIEKMMTDGEWGEFFPASLSPFGYNETVAQEYFPMKREEVFVSSLRGTKQSSISEVPLTLDRHASLHSARDDETSNTLLHWPTFNWSDYEAPFPKVEKVIPASKLPDSIDSIPDDILNWAIECEVSGKPFRIIKQELEFCRKHHLPIPRRHPDVRHMDRMKLRNPRKLFERVCDCPNCEENWKRVNSTEERVHKEKKIVNSTESTVHTEEILFLQNTRTGKMWRKMITTYSPERPEVVYCEECYNREVVG